MAAVISAAGDACVRLMIPWQLAVAARRWPFPYQHNHVIISPLGADMPSWLQFALVISSIHIEMRLSPPPHHNVITSPPSQRRETEPLWQESWTRTQRFLGIFIQNSNNNQQQRLESPNRGRVSLSDIRLSFFLYKLMFWPFFLGGGGWLGSHRLVL